MTYPLRDIPAEKIGAYAGSAIYTVGSVNDYRYFLPRILEIALRDHSFLGFEPWSIAQKLLHVGWELWEPSEIESLRCYFVHGLGAAAEHHPDEGYGFDSWLVANLSLGESAEALLKLCVSQSSMNPTCNLAYLLTLHQKSLIQHGDFGAGIWASVPANLHGEVASFLTSERFVDLLVSHGAQASEEDTLLYFSPALSIVEQLRAEVV